MSLRDLLELGFDAAVFLAAVGIGRRRPWVPLIAFVWLAPYLGGNYIGPFFLGFAPAHSIGFAIAALVIANRNAIPRDVNVLQRYVYMFLLICIAAGVIGICLAYARADYIDQWLQKPPLRVLRSTGVEMLRWMLLIAPAMLMSRERLARTVVRQAILAGAFYSALGLLQFASEQTIHYDPFPIARLSPGEAGYHTQSVIGSGLDTRINSICGEPRYLSAYCCLWFFLAAGLGKRVGLTVKGRILMAAAFVLTLILTGSRTGLLTLALSGTVGLLAAIFAGRLRQVVPIMSIGALLAGVFSYFIIKDIGSFGTRNDLSKIEAISTLHVGGLVVPIEWQDIGGLSVMMNNPWQAPIGMGPGLWQYYTNPWDQLAMSRTFMTASAVGLDSQRSNVQLIARFCDVGFVGLFAMCGVLVALYRHGRSTLPKQLRGEYLLNFALMAAVIQLAGMADLLAFLMMGAAVQVYRDLGVDRYANDRKPTRARFIRPEFSPAPVVAMENL